MSITRLKLERRREISSLYHMPKPTNWDLDYLSFTLFQFIFFHEQENVTIGFLKYFGPHILRLPCFSNNFIKLIFLKIVIKLLRLGSDNFPCNKLVVYIYLVFWLLLFGLSTLFNLTVDGND